MTDQSAVSLITSTELYSLSRSDLIKQLLDCQLELTEIAYAVGGHGTTLSQVKAVLSENRQLKQENKQLNQENEELKRLVAPF